MALSAARVVQTVDSHTEGNPTRVIVGGVPVPPGETVVEKRDWLRANNDGLRQMLNFEPRGNGMMCSVLLMPALTAEADFAAVIIEAAYRRLRALHHRHPPLWMASRHGRGKTRRAIGTATT